MQAVGILLMVFSAYLIYCGAHSLRPLALLKAIVSDPSDAGATIQGAIAAVPHESGSGDDSALEGPGSSTAKSLTQQSDTNTATGHGTQTPVGVLKYTHQNYPAALPANVQEYQRYAKSQLAKYGWSDSQFEPLVALWDQESGWNPNAVGTLTEVNGQQASALGIPQELGHAVPTSYYTNWKTQIDWGLQYIKQTYGSPAAAEANEKAKGNY